MKKLKIGKTAQFFMVNALFNTINRFVPQKWKWILEHAGFKKYFSNTGWMFFGQIFSLFVSFFIGVWLARYLGPENYGIVSYVIAFVGMFNFVAHLGVSNILYRDLIAYPDRKDELLGTSFWILFFGSISAFILVITISFLFETSIFIRTLIVLFSTTFVWSAFNVISIYFQSIVQSKRNVIAIMISGIVASILKIFLILTRQGIFYLILIFIFESLFVVLLYIYNYKRAGFYFFNWTFNKKLASNIFSGAWLLALAAAASYVFGRVDQVMVRNLLNETSVGMYAVALKLTELWYFIPGIICSSLLPAIINAKKDSEAKYKNRLKKLYFLLGGLAFLIAIVISFLAPHIINILFGNDYFEAINILRIYIWAGIGVFLIIGFYQYFLAENRLKEIFYFYFFLMIINILLNYILISKLGLAGAAWSTLISYSVGIIIIVYKFKLIYE